jgi:hypothetical protein
MNILFESPSWVFSSMLVVIPSIVACLLAVWLVRKNVLAETLRKHHDVAGFTFSIIGVLYSVILGFTVINVQDRYNKTVETIHQEATVLLDLYRDAEFFLPESRDAIRSDLKSYLTYVLKEEWAQQTKRNLRILAHKTLSRLWDDFYNIDLKTDKIKIWYEQTIGKLDALMNARLSREFSSWEHLGSMMWSLLLIGALFTVCFMFFFGLENIRMQMLMTSLLAGYLSFILYLVFSLDHVFQGPEGIKPVALEQVFSLFEQWSN